MKLITKHTHMPHKYSSGSGGSYSSSGSGGSNSSGGSGGSGGHWY